MSMIEDAKEKELVEAESVSPALSRADELEAAKAQCDHQIEIARYQAKRLSTLVEQCGLSVAISGKKYLTVDGFSVIGMLAHITHHVEWTRPWLSTEGEQIGYEARAVLKNKEGEVVSSGESSCGYDAFPCKNRVGSELQKAARSAAQTWALSRAYRNKYGFLAKMSSYESVGAEEIMYAESPVALESTGAVALAPVSTPACPKCGAIKSIIRGKAEFGGGFVCWKKKEGCGYAWSEDAPSPEKEKAANRDSGGQKNGGQLYEGTDTHEQLESLLLEHCEGDAIEMAALLETLTSWTDAKGKFHPGRRDVASISQKQAEVACQKFYSEFGQALDARD
jgi:hypothetical protein